MSKEGIPAVYEVTDKNIDHLRHVNKTEQDKLPVSERPRVNAWIRRKDEQRATIIDIQLEA